MGASQTKSNSRGFSLVELMVVISVAVLLTGLLMPAMRQLHENAHRVMCLSNLQQLGHAFLLYGNDHNDRLPYSLVLDKQDKPWDLMAARQASSPAWDGIGLLYGYNYCGLAECYYCPSHHGAHPYERYADDWDNPSPSEPIYTNYHYAGHKEWTGLKTRRTMLDGYQLVLATDGLRTAQDFNHIMGMNVLRADGSVRWRDDNQNIFDQLPKSEADLNEPDDYDSLWTSIEASD